FIGRKEEFEGGSALDLARQISGGAEDQPQFFRALRLEALGKLLQGELQIRGSRDQCLRRQRPGRQQADESQHEGEKQTKHGYLISLYLKEYNGMRARGRTMPCRPW